MRKEIEDIEFDTMKIQKEINKIDRKMQNNTNIFRVKMCMILIIQLILLIWTKHMFVAVGFGFTLGTFIMSEIATKIFYPITKLEGGNK